MSLRKQAINEGRTEYEKVCKHHGLTVFSVQSGCKLCKAARAKEWRERTGYHQEYHKREHVKAANRNRRLQKEYGIDDTKYQSMLEEQNGGCAICGANDSGCDDKPLHVDHCHETTNVRGLLCHYCNIMLGKARDDVEILRKAIVYLETHQHTK